MSAVERSDAIKMIKKYDDNFTCTFKENLDNDSADMFSSELQRDCGPDNARFLAMLDNVYSCRDFVKFCEMHFLILALD